jgi:ketosteroid isomerase-like protein
MKGPTTGPGAVVIAAANAFNAGDLEKSLGYYGDDAAVKLNGVPPGEPDSFKGKDAIRAWFKGLTQVHFQLQIEVLKVEGDTVTTKTQSWMDPTRALGVAPIVATEVYVVKDGKITSEIWTISQVSAAKLQAATTKSDPFPTGTFSAGQWVLDIKSNGFMDYDLEGRRMNTSQYKATGKLYTEMNATAESCLFGEGTYSWSYENNTLTFTLIEDGCVNRRTVLTAEKWVKK